MPLFLARLVAAENGESEIRPQDLLLGLFRKSAEGPEPSLSRMLALPDSVYSDLRTRIYGSVGPPGHADLPTADRLQPIPIGSTDFPLTGESQAILSQAISLAEGRNQEIGPVHIFLSLWSYPDELLRNALTEIGITEQRVERIADAGEGPF